MKSEIFHSSSITIDFQNRKQQINMCHCRAKRDFYLKVHYNRKICTFLTHFYSQFLDFLGVAGGPLTKKKRQKWPFLFVKNAQKVRFFKKSKKSAFSIRDQVSKMAQFYARFEGLAALCNLFGSSAFPPREMHCIFDPVFQCRLGFFTSGKSRVSTKQSCKNGHFYSLLVHRKSSLMKFQISHSFC